MSPEPPSAPPLARSARTDWGVCRACENRPLIEVLDMGALPLAGDFRPLGQPNQLYPLAIDLCERCGLLQVRQTVSHDILFGPQYSYASSTVSPLVGHFRQWASEVDVSRSAPRKLLEIGCNDGVFLAPLRDRGFQVVGVDAADNVAARARAVGLDVKTAVFGSALARQLRHDYGQFDVVTCSNVFAHNPEVREFVSAVDHLLAPQGEFWIEVHSAHALHAALQWDCFYHEHCFYWSIHALRACLGQHGFVLRNYRITTMHGGAIRAVFARNGPSAEIIEPHLSREDWADFARRSRRSRDVLAATVSTLPLRYAFGAAGRAVILINWANLAESLRFVIDASPLRFGNAIPNTKLPVISEDEFFSQPEPTEWCLVTAHNYVDTIRQKTETRRGHQRTVFVTPLPEVRIS